MKFLFDLFSSFVFLLLSTIDSILKNNKSFSNQYNAFIQNEEHDNYYKFFVTSVIFIFAVPLLIILLFRPLFLYVILPLYSTFTLYCLVLLVLAIETKFFLFTILASIAFGVTFYSSIPYWVILFSQKRKRNMTWKNTLRYYVKWFLKGPFAYKDIMYLKKAR